MNVTIVCFIHFINTIIDNYYFLRLLRGGAQDDISHITCNSLSWYSGRKDKSSFDCMNGAFKHRSSMVASDRMKFFPSQYFHQEFYPFLS